MADTIEDWEQAATVEARLRHELQAENERLKQRLNELKNKLKETLFDIEREV